METVLALRRQIWDLEEDKKAAVRTRDLEKETVVRDVQLDHRERSVGMLFKRVSLKVEMLANELVLLRCEKDLPGPRVPWRLPTIRQQASRFKKKVEVLRKELESIGNQVSDGSQGDRLSVQVASFTKRVRELMEEFNEFRAEANAETAISGSSSSDGTAFFTDFLKDYKALLAQLGHVGSTQLESRPIAPDDELKAESFDCPKCARTLPANCLFAVSTCRHRFCRKCVAMMTKHSRRLEKCPKCPSNQQEGASDSSRCAIPDSDITTLLTSGRFEDTSG